MPCWEEVLLFNEIFSYILSRQDTDPKVIIFFEVHVHISKATIDFYFSTVEVQVSGLTVERRSSALTRLNYWAGNPL